MPLTPVLGRLRQKALHFRVISYFGSPASLGYIARCWQGWGRE